MSCHETFCAVADPGFPRNSVVSCSTGLRQEPGPIVSRGTIPGPGLAQCQYTTNEAADVLATCLSNQMTS